MQAQLRRLLTLSVIAVLGCSDDVSEGGGGAGAGNAGADPGGADTGGNDTGGGGAGGGLAGGGGSGGGLPTVPNACAAGAAETTWFDDGSPHNTPDLAKVEGVVSQPVGYAEGTIDASGNYFYAFCAGPNFTEFELNLFSAEATFDFVHLHDGSNGVFGAEITPTTMTNPENQIWPVQPNTNYILELHAPGGGFF